MLRNYFKTAIRNLLRHKGFSLINILGLAIGMASAMIILLWAHHMKSFDEFHTKKSRIYQVWNNHIVNGEWLTWNFTPKILAPTIIKDVSEVEHAVRIDWSFDRLFTVGDKKLYSNGQIVDSNFLQVFTFPLLEGNPRFALQNHSIVLTKTLAKKLFGNESAMGKTVLIDNEDIFTVTGILEDLPANTRFNFEYLLPYSYLVSFGNDDKFWGNNSITTYVLLKENTSLAAANAKMKVMRPKYEPSEPNWQMFFYPMSRWHLYSNFSNGVENNKGEIVMVRVFSTVAIMILLIACINFMNLSTARSANRSKEIGVRKVLGAQKRTLVVQFIGESILIAIIAGIIAICLTALVLPVFNQLFAQRLSFDLTNRIILLMILGCILLTGLLAGSYPAFFLASFKPIAVLKGHLENPKTLITPRKLLVILQFTFSIFLIIGTLIIKQQINFVKEREIGYNRNNLIYHPFTGDMHKNYTLLKEELLSSGVATYVLKTSSPPTERRSSDWGQEWQGRDPHDKTSFDQFSEDGGLGKAIGLQFIAGRDIDLQQFSTDSTAMIINESALKATKFKDPIGQIIKQGGKEWHIIGIFKDFIITSPYESTRPMLITGPPHTWMSTLLIKLNDKRPMSDNLKRAENIFKKYNPHFPFVYKFVDEEYARKLEGGKRLERLVGIFTILTIIISCLGLFGLAAYMAEARVKEVGIRKVLGSSVTGITALLSKDFLKLVILSFVLAFPIAWWAMNRWLQDFDYRISIQWWVFAVAGIIAVLIALITVSSLAIRAAIANPVNSLRTE